MNLNKNKSGFTLLEIIIVIIIIGILASLALPKFFKTVEYSRSMEALTNLGNVYHAVGEDEEAIALLKKALETDPNYASAYEGLAILYFHQKKYSLAVDYCVKAQKHGFVNAALLKALQPYMEREQKLQE